MIAATRTLASGERLLIAGMVDTVGTCWRITHGTLRLSRPDGLNDHFAGLALAGDIIGSEALLGQPSIFSAHALSRVELTRCTQLDSTALLTHLHAAARRTADVLALRGGTAEARLQQLLRLLAKSLAESPAESATAGHTPLMLPSLREMAEITDLTQETVSRLISRLRRLGLLAKHTRAHATIATAYLQPAAFPCLALAA